VKIYPFDAHNSPTEAGPSILPFFQMKYKPLLPNPLPIPINLDLFQYLGIDPIIGQPPLPAGNGSYGEVPGTSAWAETLLGARSNYPTPGTFDLDQGAGDDTGNGYNAAGDEYFPNFWPGLPRHNIGVKMEKSTIEFPVPETWSQ
jgi:hypothetical protein